MAVWVTSRRLTPALLAVGVAILAALPVALPRSPCCPSRVRPGGAAINRRGGPPRLGRLRTRPQGPVALQSAGAESVGGGERRRFSNGWTPAAPGEPPPAEAPDLRPHPREDESAPALVNPAGPQPVKARHERPSISIPAEHCHTHLYARSTGDTTLCSTDSGKIRYAARTLRRDAGFTWFATLIVGLGIGASATVFSVANAVIIRPLPFREPAQLVWITNRNSSGLSGQTTQVANFLDLRDRNGSFSEVAGYFAFYGVGDSKLTGNGPPERLSAVPVSQNFFPLLGVEPALGRYFTADECRNNGPRVVMLSHNVWQRRSRPIPRLSGARSP